MQKKREETQISMLFDSDQLCQTTSPCACVYKPSQREVITTLAVQLLNIFSLHFQNFPLSGHKPPSSFSYFRFCARRHESNIVVVVARYTCLMTVQWSHGGAGVVSAGLDAGIKPAQNNGRARREIAVSSDGHPISSGAQIRARRADSVASRRLHQPRRSTC